MSPRLPSFTYISQPLFIFFPAIWMSKGACRLKTGHSASEVHGRLGFPMVRVTVAILKPRSRQGSEREDTKRGMGGAGPGVLHQNRLLWPGA